MVDSQNFAEVTALRRLGNPVVEQGEGATMEQVDPRTPAAGHLKPGDLVTVADGKPVAIAQDLRSEIQARKPGDVLTLTVTGPEQGATPRTETITLGPRPDNPKVAFLGVVFITHNQHFHMPFDVKIDSGRIGGPSAGLAFTLGLLDELTPGELTGGQKVAATGTIDPNGNVGPIGGARQKTVAVIAQHAKVFIVPADDYNDAKARAGNQVRVIPVCTLEDALNVLHSLGGDTAALGPPPATLATQPAPDCKIPAGAGR
jgi:PDZ domain-containing protein